MIREALDAMTISSQLDPNERELLAKFPKWSAPEQSLRGSSPANVKAKQVFNVLQSLGLTSNPENKKKVTQKLLPFIQDMDPVDAFAADPSDIASEFAAQVLGVKQN